MNQAGSPLETLKGSKVSRSNKYNVGKVIGGKIYFHKTYDYKILPTNVFDVYLHHREECPFKFNCIRYNLNTHQVALVECPDFDEAREPVVGRMFLISLSGLTKVTPFYNHLYHHKWTFVDNDYTGFNVRASWEWSKKWLAVLTEPANGTSMQGWTNQLKKFNL